MRQEYCNAPPASNRGPAGKEVYSISVTVTDRSMCHCLVYSSRKSLMGICVTACNAHLPPQLLRMEAATQNETRRLLGCLDVAFYLSVAALLVYLVLRWQPIDAQGTMFICTTTFRSVRGVAVYQWHWCSG